MPVRKSTATAFVNVRGLAIACFNPAAGRSEVAIIRDPAHELSVIVTKPGLLDVAGADAVGFIEVVIFKPDELAGATIEICGVGNPAIQGFEWFLGDDFARLSGAANDPNDFRWILNLEDELHGETLVKNEASLAGRPEITPLFISNALFYAVMPDLESEKALAGFPYFMRKDGAGRESEFGYIAETMGANIEADAVTLRITRDGQVTEHIFERAAGSPFRIEISNVNPAPDADVSDLPMYYRFLQSASGEMLELTPRDEDSTAGGPVQGRNYCHIARVGKGTIGEVV